MVRVGAARFFFKFFDPAIIDFRSPLVSAHAVLYWYRYTICWLQMALWFKIFLFILDIHVHLVNYSNIHKYLYLIFVYIYYTLFHLVYYTLIHLLFHFHINAVYDDTGRLGIYLYR